MNHDEWKGALYVSLGSDQFLALISGDIRRSFVSWRRERPGIASGTTLRPAHSINDQHLALASCHPAKGSPPRRLATCRPNISNEYFQSRLPLRSSSTCRSPIDSGDSSSILLSRVKCARNARETKATRLRLESPRFQPNVSCLVTRRDYL